MTAAVERLGDQAPAGLWQDLQDERAAEAERRAQLPFAGLTHHTPGASKGRP
jgi:hypothetical protein